MSHMTKKQLPSIFNSQPASVSVFDVNRTASCFSFYSVQVAMCSYTHTHTHTHTHTSLSAGGLTEFSPSAAAGSGIQSMVDDLLVGQHLM